MSERDDWTQDAGDELAGLLERARRASEVGMAESDAARVWERVRRRPARPRTPRVWLIASVAAALLMVAALARMNQPTSIEIVKEIAFESVHDGQVVRFEMTVYRETRKEKADAEKPSL